MPLRALVLGAMWAIWGLCLVGLLYALVIEAVLQDGIACEYGDSEYGAFTWSWLPPGAVCTFSGTDGPTHTYPSWFRLTTLVLLLIFPLLAWVLRTPRRTSVDAVVDRSAAEGARER